MDSPASPRFPLSALGYVGQGLDRAAHLRRDEALAPLIAQGANHYLLAGDRLVLRKGEAPRAALFSQAEAERLGAAPLTVFLGLKGTEARFARHLDREASEAAESMDGIEVVPLRAVAVDGLVETGDLTAIAEAKAVLGWHRSHAFCAHCGAPSQAVSAGWRRDCPACNTQHFPRTDPVVIMAVTDGDRCLLGNHGRLGGTMWTCLAGFMEPGETVEDAVRREVFEETAVRCGAVRYLASQPWPFPANLMIGCHAVAESTAITVDKSELDDARWFTRAEVRAMAERRHPDGFTLPPAMAIAPHLLSSWIRGD